MPCELSQTSQRLKFKVKDLLSEQYFPSYGVVRSNSILINSSLQYSSMMFVVFCLLGFSPSNVLPTSPRYHRCSGILDRDRLEKGEENHSMPWQGAQIRDSTLPCRGLCTQVARRWDKANITPKKRRHKLSGIQLGAWIHSGLPADRTDWVYGSISDNNRLRG